VAEEPTDTPKASRGLTYRDSGVDVDEEARNVKALVSALRPVREGRMGEPIPLPGGYAGLVSLGEHALALCTDGVGSKLEIARAMGRYDTVGIDCMAMNVNDAICVGAEPIAFVDYLAVEKHDEAFMKQVGQGLARAAEMADVTIIGGETATLPGIVSGFDLAGTCLAVAPKDRVITGKKIQPGDTMIGIASHGLHSNGYSLVRRLVEQEGLRFEDPFPGHGLERHSLGDVLLEPTRIYVALVKTLMETGIDIHALAHVTGGGLLNLPRMNDAYGYRITTPLKPQAVYEWIQQAGNVETAEMYRTFNMGMGLTVVVAEDDAQETLKTIHQATKDDRPLLVGENQGEAPRIIGHVETGTGVHLEPHDLHFSP
jgi:phosphoribosylformylglycinamidine cyclo-ligase